MLWCRDPHAALHGLTAASANCSHPMSSWHSLGNPCQGHSSIDAAYTFWSQPAFVLPIASHPGQYIFMADRWQPTNLAESRCAAQRCLRCSSRY